MPTVYNFEAKSIQHYILESGKLKDMIGASEQIEYLCCDKGLLDQAKVQFARKAGGAFAAIFSKHQEAERFQAAWTFCVQKVCPGLEFVQGIGTGEDLKVAIEKAANAFKTDDHNRLLFLLPLAGPLVARNPRTGQPAVFLDRVQGREERLDAITKTKRHPKFRSGRALLIDKLGLKNEGELVYYWPTNLEFQEQSDEEITFPFLKDNQYLGIIHADGNDLGQLSKAVQDQLLKNPDSYARIMRDFSEAIQDTTVKSARQATIHLTGEVDKFSRIIPARSLVLGGDDLTFIVRGDLALDFTKVFLEKFEECSQQALTQLKDTHNELKKILPEQLTACAGIAYIKASQPFYQGYDLAESLCKHAKTFSHEHLDKNKLMPSSIAFHRITTSLIGDYKTILERELTIGSGNERIQITMQPYLVGDVKATVNNHECVYLTYLQTLFDFLNEEEVSHGTAREFLSLLEIDRNQAEQAMQRWYDNMDKRGEMDLLNRFEQVLEKLIQKPDANMDQKQKFLKNQNVPPSVMRLL